MDSGADVGSRVPSIEKGVTCLEAVIGMFAMSWAYICWLLSRFCSTYGGDASLSYGVYTVMIGAGCMRASMGLTFKSQVGKWSSE